MKKRYLLIGILTTLLLFGLTKGSSDELVDFINNLGTSIEFGYTIDDVVEVSNITADKITFESPFIFDESDNKIDKYIIMYNNSSLEDMTNDSDLLNNSKEKAITIDDTAGSKFTMDLIADDDQVPSNEIYYALVIPENTDGVLGEISNEICFKLESKIYGEGDDCVNGNGISFDDEHNAGGADMSLASISHTKNGNTITLRWLAIDGSDDIDIFLRDNDDEEYNLLDTVNMDDEEYSFTSTRDGEHIVKFTPDNGGREHVYTFTVTGITPTPAPSTPGVTSVPKVGPKENIIAVLIFTLLGYFIYRKAKRSS
ncbi:hypothetical protein K9M48_03070 [Candidatus Gracilibacteria bacterium]|nr:hypothetical protein [Candidatus Gracilibacteria bacterium]